MVRPLKIVCVKYKQFCTKSEIILIPAFPKKLFSTFRHGVGSPSKTHSIKLYLILNFLLIEKIPPPLLYALWIHNFNGYFNYGCTESTQNLRVESKVNFNIIREGIDLSHKRRKYKKIDKKEKTKKLRKQYGWEREEYLIHDILLQKFTTFLNERLIYLFIFILYDNL